MTSRPVSLMIQGAGSNVGKSMLVAGLARALKLRGMRVRPFKPQNMSNNAAATPEGGEIGRAQALQARACGIAPHVDMNPVLLKPESETGAQVVVRGKVMTTAKARDYKALKPKLLPKVLESFAAVGRDADIVLVEGAGSPAEINLRAGDIANMGFARAAEVPVVLTGDIDRGGVIAQLVGTHAVLDPEDRAMIRGFLVNKFRGDVSLFEGGMAEIAGRTGWRPLGVAPWFADAHKLPAEDAADLRTGDEGGPVRIAAPIFSRIANFDDLDPLRLDPAVSLTMVRPGRAIPECDLVLLPGSKATLADLADLRAQGWDVDIQAHVRRGGRVLGLCGGYQMMGRRIADPDGLEGAPGEVKGLGLLDIETVMTPEKSVRTARGVHLESGARVTGYEIHIGRTRGPDCDRPLFELDGEGSGGGRLEGATSLDGRCMGAYLHGLFAEDRFRAAWLRARGAPPSTLAYDAVVDETLDALAAHLEAHLDVDAMLQITRNGRR